MPLSKKNETQTIRKGIQSVEIGFHVLNMLARAGKPLALKEISALSDLSSSQTHRYLASLINSNMVVQDPISGRYDLGRMALEIGLAALNRLDSLHMCEKRMDDLVEQTKQTAMLAIWGENGPVAVRWRRGRSLLFTSVGLGTNFPLLNSATGQIFLAYMPQHITAPLVQAERRRLKGDQALSQSQIKDMVTNIKQQGYVQLDGHFVSGMWAASAPVLDLQAELVSCFTLIGAAGDDKQRRAQDTKTLIKMAYETSRRLGYRSDKFPPE